MTPTIRSLRAKERAAARKIDKIREARHEIDKQIYRLKAQRAEILDAEIIAVGNWRVAKDRRERAEEAES